jgi:hypothetical protein
MIITNDSTYKEMRNSVMGNLDAIKVHIREVSDKEKAKNPENQMLIEDLAYVAEQLDLLHCFLTGEG